MKILIIRHGEPDYSIDSLTEKGWREAKLLADRLSKMNIDDYYVSPLGRARDTAKATLQRTGKDAETLNWLQEFHGRIMNPKDGRPEIPWDLIPQYWSRQPELYDREKWRENPLYQTGDVLQVYDETILGFDELLKRYGYTRSSGALYHCENNDETTIALFCHFGVAMVMLSHLLNTSPALMWHNFILPASSITVLATEERIKGEVFFRCQQMGDTSHLYAADEPLSRAGMYSEVYGKWDPMGAR